MKIMIIGESPPPEAATYFKANCSPGTTLVFSGPETALPLTKDFSIFSLNVPGIIYKAKEAEQEQFDAAIINCFTDSGLEPAKITTGIPIIGLAESTLYVACLLADKFGMITPIDDGVPFHWRQVRNYGMADRISSIRAINLPFDSYFNDKNKVEERLIQLGKEMIDEGAQLIILGCGFTFPSLGIGSVKRLSDKLGAAFLDPIAIALRTAEMLVTLDLCQSSLAYPNGPNVVLESLIS